MGTPKDVVICERSPLDFIPVFCSTFDISPSESVPSYMVPNNTHQLDAFPLTKNGKIDRTALAILARIKR